MHGAPRSLSALCILLKRKVKRSVDSNRFGGWCRSTATTGATATQHNAHATNAYTKASAAKAATSASAGFNMGYAGKAKRDAYNPVGIGTGKRVPVKRFDGYGQLVAKHIGACKANGKVNAGGVGHIKQSIGYGFKAGYVHLLYAGYKAAVQAV